MVVDNGDKLWDEEEEEEEQEESEEVDRCVEEYISTGVSEDEEGNVLVSPPIPSSQHNQNNSTVKFDAEFPVIDLQGFQLGRSFVVKELAIYDGNRLAHYVFKPPIPYINLSYKDRRRVNWLERNHHSLRYSDGHVHFSEFPLILKRFTKNFQKVYVKGHQKKDILKLYLDIPIVNLENFKNTPALRETVSNCCMYHKNHPSICAIINVKILYNFLNVGNK